MICQIFPTFAAEFQQFAPVSMVFSQLATMIGRWCNGNTTGFGSVIPGSNPSRPTKESQSLFSDWLSFCFLHLPNAQTKNDYLEFPLTLD